LIVLQCCYRMIKLAAVDRRMLKNNKAAVDWAM